MEPVPEEGEREMSSFPPSAGCTRGAAASFFLSFFPYKDTQKPKCPFSPFKDTQLSFFSKFTQIFMKLDNFERNFVIICLQNLVGAYMNDFCVGF